MRVLYFLNYAPNYRDKFLRELAKEVDLTVVAYNGAEAKLKDPNERIGYKYVELKRRKFWGFHFNLKEFTLANGDYDVIIVGYSLWYPFRMLNFFRRKQRVIGAGIIYGRNSDFVTRMLRRIIVNKAEGFLVYSDLIKNKLIKETSKPILSFNNTSFYKREITPLPIPELKKNLNLIWVGRYLERKKVERLYHLAQADQRVSVRLIGPGIREALKDYDQLSNLEIYDRAYGDELKEYFLWSHITFNPGGAGLLVMNSARFQRGIVIDQDGFHGPEIQLAKEANQDFIDFSDLNKVEKVVDHIFEHPEYLREKAIALCSRMHYYTIEHMVGQYMKAIKNEWSV